MAPLTPPHPPTIKKGPIPMGFLWQSLGGGACQIFAQRLKNPLTEITNTVYIILNTPLVDFWDS